MEKISEKINHLLRINGLNQNDLADKIGVSKQVINSICHDKVKHSKALYPIAKYFDVDYNWLVSQTTLETDQRQGSSILVLDKFNKIPLLTTRVLDKEFIVNGKLIFKNCITDEFELTNDTEYPFLFTLLSTNNALKFRFGDNCTLIFHTNLVPSSGDFVIAYLPEKELFVYRDLKIVNGRKILVPIDEDIYKPLTLKKTDLIVAVLYEKRIKRPFRL